MNRKGASVALIVVSALLLVITVLLLTIAWVSYRAIETRQWKQLKESQVLLTNQLAVALSLPVWNFDRAQIDRILDSVMRDQVAAGVLVSLTDWQGSAHGRIRGADGGVRASTDAPKDDGLLAYSQEIRAESNAVGHVKVFFSPHLLEEDLRATRRSMLLTVLVLDVAMVLFLFLLLRRLIIKPLAEIETFASSIGYSGISLARLSGNRFHGELERLRDAIASMIGLLGQRYAALQQSEQRFRTLLNSAPIALWEIDLSMARHALVSTGMPRGADIAPVLRDNAALAEIIGEATNLMDCNRAALDLFEAQDIAELQTHIRRAAAAPDRPAFRESLAGVWSGRAPSGGVSSIVTARGNARDVIILWSILPGFEESWERVLICFSDITARRAIETALADARDRLEVATEMARLAPWEYDLETGIFHFGEHFYDLYRTTSEREGGPSMTGAEYARRFLAPQDRHLLEREWRLVRQSDGPRFTRQFEHRIVRGDGSDGFVVVRYYAIADTAGRIVTLRGANQDITERRRAEEEVLRLNVDLEKRVAERTAELTSLNTALEEFTASVSHDLRAPVRRIAQLGELLHEGSLGADVKASRQIDLILNEAHHASTLIDDLLALARLGQADVARASVDLRSLVREVCDVVDYEGSRDIRWMISDLPVVQADYRLLRQAFANLIANAVKFTRGRQPAVIEIGAQADTPETGQYVLYVRDNGVGFEMNYAGNLFGAFQRLHSSEQFEGTGVGLATVRRIVERHGGRIWAEARVGEGATFYIALPR